MEYNTLPTTISGTISRYKGNGRKLGYPTANIGTVTDLTDGVYFGYADMAGFSHHPALIFIGVPVTVGDTKRRVETHLLDIPDEDYYDRSITVTVERHFRENQNFGSVQELLKAMKEDEKHARIWFAKMSKIRQ